MAKVLDRFQPTLFEFPIQNNRTGWHPVWTPTILVVPWSFDVNRNRIAGSKINSITFAIEDIKQIKVSGHPQDYNPLGPKPNANPNLILFEITLTYEQLLRHIIEYSNCTFYDQEEGGNAVEDPVEGDWMEFTNARGIQSRVEYLPDAEYFDLSYVEINVDNLPSDRYIASWLVNYYERIPTDNVLYCINDNEQKRKLDYLINHPGEIHEEMVKRTPSIYLEDVDKKEDFTVNLYRPFADILQDHFDESELFYGINWIQKIPAQLFPYLSYLIGIELPTQGGNQDLDKIRRRMLERGVELQKLKGSELAIKELFSILGFVIEITNLWVSSDGDRFFAPNEPDLLNINKTQKNEITSIVVSQTDPAVANYSTSGFGDFNIPLLYHNKENKVVLTSYIVENDSQAHVELESIINGFVSDSNYLTKETIINDSDGYLKIPSELGDISTDGIETTSRLVVSDIEVLSQNHSGLPIIRFDGVRYEINKDQLSVNFADYKDLSNSSAYVFITYKRDELIVPEHLENNQSNRFDVNIISKSGDIDSSLYDYLIDSLFKFKAFHSLLRKINYDLGLRDFYNVTDFCNNAFLSQQRDSDANALMLPPACPEDECFVTDGCNERNARGGLRESDYEFRNIILEGLKEEYDRWHDVTQNWIDVSDSNIEWAQSISNINIEVPNNEGDSFGQDRVSFDFVVQVDESTPINLSIGDRLDVIYKKTYLEVINTDSTILNIQTTKYQILSNIDNVGVEIEILRQINSDSYYVKMHLDVDHQTDIRSKITKLDRLSTPDYCYKGRARDFVDLDPIIPLKTVVRNKPCNLMQGLGIYYNLDSGSLDNLCGWYNDRLKKSDQTLHYSNDLFFENLYHGSHLRPSIEIEKQTQSFPGHRQLRGGLLVDFVHPAYKARPWDISNECLGLINPLNARLIKIAEFGIINESLEFDVEDLIYEADNIVPDIPTYSGESTNEFTHSIYSTIEDSLYVSLDNIIYTGDTQINTEVPIFETAKQCGTAGYSDYKDGYPASTGELSFDSSEIWSEREIDSGILIESDLQATSGISASATYSSEILIEKAESETIKIYNGYELWRGHRYDCNCSEYLCESTERNCNDVFFRDSNGRYDFNNDHLEIDYVASLNETISGEIYKYDGNILDWLNWEFDDTGPNEFKFKDEYGIQYYVEFEENEEILDITYETFQPRVWGKEQTDGYMENGKVFREGILTTIRQIFISNNGDWELNAEGSNQIVTYRQTNYDCDNITPEDKFIHRQEYSIDDQVEMRVTVGPHWTDPDEVDDNYSVWAEQGGYWNPTEGPTNSDYSSFMFIDVW